jgi:hypothetical protein
VLLYDLVPQELRDDRKVRVLHSVQFATRHFMQPI